MVRQDKYLHSYYFSYIRYLFFYLLKAVITIYIAFPADGKVKASLDVVYKSLRITCEERLEKALIESMYDVSIKFLSNPEEAKAGSIFPGSAVAQ